LHGLNTLSSSHHPPRAHPPSPSAPPAVATCSNCVPPSAESSPNSPVSARVLPHREPAHCRSLPCHPLSSAPVAFRIHSTRLDMDGSFPTPLRLSPPPPPRGHQGRPQ